MDMVATGLGYNFNLPSEAPFMYIENKSQVSFSEGYRFAAIAYGAYNALGLIGPEKGGVAVVMTEPQAKVLATKDFPYNPVKRAAEFDKVLRFLAEASEEQDAVDAVDRLVRQLNQGGYLLRLRVPDAD
jgi:hypothetical protein